MTHLLSEFRGRFRRKKNQPQKKRTVRAIHYPSRAEIKEKSTSDYNEYFKGDISLKELNRRVKKNAQPYETTKEQ